MRQNVHHDHHYPSEMSVDAMVQTYLMDDSSDSTVKFLKPLIRNGNAITVTSSQKYKNEEEKAS
ncbi:MAG: hypothetical protein ACLUOF_06280 [Ruminococcus sp.]